MTQKLARKDRPFKTTTRPIVCKLTEPERLQMGDLLAAKELEYTQVEKDKKAAMDDFKEQLDAIAASIKALSETITAGEEERQLECYIVPDVTANTITYVRTDTDEVVHERSMTQEERQRGLFEA
jgi:hypothetical protein